MDSSEVKTTTIDTDCIRNFPGIIYTKKFYFRKVRICYSKQKLKEFKTNDFLNNSAKIIIY